MYKIATLNKISPKGLERFNSHYTIIDDREEANGILVRSQDMHSMILSDSLLAISRAGAGVNNIPVDLCSQKGIVVFNTPGANANAVKELVLTGILMTARNVTNAIAWTKTIKEDVSITVEKNNSRSDRSWFHRRYGGKCSGKFGNERPRIRSLYVYRIST